MEHDLVRSKKSIKRAESNKANPWWWEGHIGLKNSKWLENNLDEMDRSVKRMVKLIEEDADSFAKKAEMYFKKRPELIATVDEFHRMYRALAERYENITGELRKSSELQSQSSGVSDISSSELNTELVRLGRPPSRRAPGFDYFLGAGGHPSDLYHKDGDDSASITDSELESDDSSVTGYVSIGSDFQSLSKRVNDLEVELREAKERLRMQLEGNTESLLTRVKSETKFIDFPAKLAACEQELREANEKIQISEDQIYMLKRQLARYLPSELDDEHSEEAVPIEDLDVQPLSEELRITTLRLREAEKENGIMRKEVEKGKSDEAKLKNLQNLLECAQKETAAWKSKSTADRREVGRLQDRVSMLKSSLAGRDHEIRDLKIAVSDAEEKIFPEKAQVKGEIAKLLEEKTHRDEQFKVLEADVRYLEDEIRRVSNEKMEEEERLKGEIERLEGEIEALTAEKEEKERCIERISEKVSELETEMVRLESELKASDSRTMEMEKEVEKQRIHLEEVAEEKREVIRQLCFSLDYSKDECKMLRRARPTRPSIRAS